MSREEAKNLKVHQTPRLSEHCPRAPEVVGRQGTDEGALGPAAQRRAEGCELGSRAHPAFAWVRKRPREPWGGEAASTTQFFNASESLCLCHEDQILPTNKRDCNTGAV